MYDFITFMQGFFSFFLTTVLFAKIYWFPYFSLVIATGYRHRSYGLELKLCFLG